MNDRPYIVLTGATGLLGQYLMRDLLARGHRVAVIVRPNKKQSAEERIEQIMQMWDEQLGQPQRRPMVLEGDITQPLIGLSQEDLDWVTAHAGTMLHCAASLVFNELNGEPYRTNIEGTRHTLDLCRAAEIDVMHYISTAYVCGRQEELVKEDQFDVGQEFRNDYEKSKFEAERLVRDHGFDSLTVFRPVVITGDSVTGYTSTYHGTYLYMKVAKVLATNFEPDEDGYRNIPVRWGLTGDERRNITPVDWNSEVICRLFENPQAHGRTFHLAPAQPITMREAMEFGTDFFKIKGLTFAGYGLEGPAKGEPRLNDMEKWLWANIQIYGSYDFMDPQFDWTNLEAFCPEPVCPPIDHECARRLIEFAEDDKWGRKKKPAPRPAPVDVEQTLLERMTPQAANGVAPQRCALQVRGAGGGDWTLSFHGDALVDVQRGASAGADTEVTLDSDQLAYALEHEDLLAVVLPQVSRGDDATLRPASS
ncbi:MAG: SDR family oxidoreductase [Planctomycetota bacterium]